MSKQNIQGIVSHRKFTHAEWSNSNPVLFDGEIIFVEVEDGTLKQKIGDGVSTYLELEFYLENLEPLIVNINNIDENGMPSGVDKNFEEITHAFNKGKKIYLMILIDTLNMLIPLCEINSEYAMFITAKGMTLSIMSDNSIQIDTSTFNKFELIQDIGVHTVDDPPSEEAVIKYVEKKIKDTVGQKQIINGEIKGEVFNHYETVIVNDITYDKNIASGDYSHAEGLNTKAFGKNSHAEGYKTQSLGGCSHAEGGSTITNGIWSHAEGIDSIAEGLASHAEGNSTLAYGSESHAEGNSTIAYGDKSHVEGYSTKEITVIYNDDGTLKSDDEIITYWQSNKFNIAMGRYSHVEGRDNISIGVGSHAEGKETCADGDNTHTEGLGTITNSNEQHAQGRYNQISTTYAHIVGNGTSDIDRKNAHTLDWDGNAWFAGDIYVGGTNQDDSENLITKIKTLKPKDFIVNLSVDIDEDGNLINESIDKTNDEISEAIQSGCSVYLKFVNRYIPLNDYNSESQEFSFYDTSGARVQITGDGTIYLKLDTFLYRSSLIADMEGNEDSIDGCPTTKAVADYVTSKTEESLSSAKTYADETKSYTIILTCGSVPEISDEGTSIYTVNNIAVSAVGISGGLSEFSEDDLFSAVHYLDGHGYTGARVIFQLDSSKMCEYIGEIPLMRMDRDGNDSTYCFTKTVIDNGTLVQVNIYYYSIDQTWSVEIVPITKTEIGLGNIDNTSDLDKPISNATQLALNEINSKIGDINTILTQVHNYAQNTYLGGGEE